MSNIFDRKSRYYTFLVSFFLLFSEPENFTNGENIWYNTF